VVNIYLERITQMFKKTASPAAHAGYKKKWSVLVIVIIIQNLLVRSAGTARGWLQRARCFFSLPNDRKLFLYRAACTRHGARQQRADLAPLRATRRACAIQARVSCKLATALAFRTDDGGGP
jgi:hypothetical protein